MILLLGDAEYKDRDWTVFKFEWEYYIASDDFNKNNSKVAKAIWYEWNKNIQKILHPEDIYVYWEWELDVSNTDVLEHFKVEDWTIDTSYSIEKEMSVSTKETEETYVETEEILSNNTNNKMSKINELKRKAYFTESKEAEILKAVDAANEVTDNLRTAANKIIDIVNTIDWIYSNLNKAVDEGNVTEAETNLTVLNGIVNKVKTLDKVSDFIEFWKEFNKSNATDKVQEVLDRLWL